MRSIRLIAASLLAFAPVPLSAQTFGPPITGMCLLSRTGAIGASRAGQSTQSQLKQMQGTLSGELARRRAATDQQRRTLEARRNATAPIEYQRQLAALDQQAQVLEQQQNSRFIAAQTYAQQQLDRALGAALARVITREACSVVLERDKSYGWNNAMDITGAVTGEMDRNLQAVSMP
jgi:Skp family chaperone for outer membrane proteins